MRYLFIALAFSVFYACDMANQKDEKNAVPVQNFDHFKNEFVERLWQHRPIWASYEGYHTYDYMLPIPDEQYYQELTDFVHTYRNALAEFDFEALDEANKIDYHILQDFFQRELFYIEELKAFQWQPSSYNLGGAFYQVINYRDHDLKKRLEDINRKLDHVPAYYAQARKNLLKPTRVHTELAIQQLPGSKKIFESNLLDSLKKTDFPDTFKSQFTQKVNRAVAAIDSFALYLENEILPELPEDDESFRIGEEMFEKKFKHEIQSDFTAKEIFEIAVREKEKLHEQMYQLSEMLWEDHFGNREKPGGRLEQVKMLIDKVAEDHVHRDSFITAIEKQIPRLEEFIREHDLLTLDPEKPLVVRPTPEYMRGFAGASISAPGPYDKKAETYYNVTPLDHYTEEEAESYLREYNRFVLEILNIHEAIPGHYTQLVYANQSPSIIKSIMGNGAMVEGWAVYTERMMLEQGYGGDEMEMGLMYYKWNLRTVCNTILDYGVHVHNFTKEEAMQLLMREAFQEKAEAEGKWKRAKLSQVQLCSYFTGYHEIMQLREEVMNERGEAYDLKEFHEQFLSYGSAPVKYIREMMLEKKEDKPVS